jgi:hypothetical protein
VSRTKAVFPRELTDFATALDDSVLHGTKEVFDLLQSLDLDDDTLKYNDKLVLASVLVKSKELKAAGADPLGLRSTNWTREAEVLNRCVKCLTLSKLPLPPKRCLSGT